MANITTKRQKINSTKSKDTKSIKEIPKSNSKKVESEDESEELESEEEEEQSSDSEDEGNESESDIEEDDELDIADVSSEENSSSDSDSEEFEEDIPKLKKKKNTDDGSSSFSTAVNAILGSKLKKYDRTDPILVRSKQKIKKFEDEKLEQKARRLINQERKLKLNSNRIRDLLPKEDSKAREILQQEKEFKKIAQRGVIKLFNAVLLTQTSSLKTVANEKITGVDKKEELINEISKEKFLELVQNTGK